VSIISEVEGMLSLVSVKIVAKQVAINQKLTTMHVIYYYSFTVIQRKRANFWCLKVNCAAW